MQKTRLPTPQLVILLLLASLLAPLGLLMSQAPQALAAPASQTVPTATHLLPRSLSRLATQDGLNQTEEWSTVANLSQSGGASNPSMVLENGDQFHIFWDDEFSGSHLVSGDHNSWSRPISVTAPFSGTVPLLLSGDAENIFSFWRDEELESLLFSAAASPELEEDNAWSIPQSVADGVLSYDALADENGLIHLVYARNVSADSANAGIYYQFSEDQGSNWSDPVALYESPYFRSMRARDTNVVLEMAENVGETYLYAGWDVRPRKRLFFARSIDGGQNWDVPVEVAGPESTSSIILPFNLQIGADGSDLLLTWQRGQIEGACQLYYQTSADRGVNWSQRRQIDDMLPGVPSCPNDNRILRGSDLFYLLTTFPEQVFLTAWNGERWSEPQPQRTLTRFNDPETLNTVNLGCKQIAVTEDDQLYVAGCDMTALDLAQGDIWYLSRSLGTPQSWFPSPETWSDVDVIQESAYMPHYPQLISENTGLTHAIWAQSEGPSNALTAIYHSQWDGSDWTLPAQILSSPAPIADLRAATRSAADRVYLLWTTTSGEPYFSQAGAGQLEAATNWSPPETVPIDADANVISIPAVIIGDSGTLYVAYAIPINEQRGIYLMQSTDNGQTWSAARLLFDAQAAGWQIVGAPKMAIAPDETIHLLFDERQWSATKGEASNGLYYIQCAGPESDCTNPLLVSAEEALWKEISRSGQSLVHRLWQVSTEDGSSLQHQVSRDGGGSWGAINTVVSTDSLEALADTTVVADDTGRLHLFAATGGVLQSWIWEQDAWRADQSLNRELSRLPVGQHELAAGLSQDGDLVLAYVDSAPPPFVPLEEDAQEDTDFALLAIDRAIGASAPPPEATDNAFTPAEGATPEPTVNDMQTPAPDISPSPSPPLALPPETPEDSGFSIPFLDGGNPISFLLVSLVPVLLVIVVALIIGLRRTRSRRR